jgi:hypothetical protein
MPEMLKEVFNKLLSVTPIEHNLHRLISYGVMRSSHFEFTRAMLDVIFAVDPVLLKEIVFKAGPRIMDDSPLDLCFALKFMPTHLVESLFRTVFSTGVFAAVPGQCPLIKDPESADEQ